jgi:glycosyltransferase involved in cell wall biosynthesis
MQNRSSFPRSLAGDSVQLLKTRDYLEKLGVTVAVSSEPAPDLSGFDLVHLFNIMPVEETYQFYLNAKRQQKQIVLSTVFWDPEEYLFRSKAIDQFGEWWRRTMPLRTEILNGVDLILPNSRMEEAVLAKYFHSLPKSMIVPNAADRIFANAHPGRFRLRYHPPEEFVLAVGRVCKRKNQLPLVEAAAALRMPLVIIGPLNDTEYYRSCRKASAGSRTMFIDALGQGDLASAYAAAKVHALVSWYDTPGLVSLEAGLAGCRIVSTDRGCAREYLGDSAFYCDPGDPGSIRHALQSAWISVPDQALKERILTNYLWDNTALATYNAYRSLVEENAP